MALIELRDVTRRFGDLTAVDEVTLDVEEGEIVGLLGHNGAGKTTLIRVINGLLFPDAGTVTVDGLDPTRHGDQVRRRTGVLTEYPALDEYLTARENLTTYAAINAVPAREAAARIDLLVAHLGLTEKQDVAARSLSAGLKQRVALARALVHDPTILLLDEPTTNMDPVAARDVRDLIVDSARRRGRTVLLSTHNLAEAEALCDRVAIIRNGRLLRSGSPAGLRAEQTAFGGVRVGTHPRHLDQLLRSLRNGSTPHRIDDATVEVQGDVDVAALVARLVAEGVPIRRVEPLEGSLEDLYVALHAEQDTTTNLDQTPTPREVAP